MATPWKICMSHQCLYKFGYKVSLEFRKEKLEGVDRGEAGGGETGAGHAHRESQREHRCASHRASEERPLLSQAEEEYVSGRRSEILPSGG